LRQEKDQSFSLLSPVQVAARTDKLSVLPPINDPSTDLSFIFTERPSPSAIMAIDFETRGDYTSPGSTPVGVGLSDERGSWYIDFKESRPDTYEWIMRRLAADRVPLIGHNLFFDAAWPLRDLGLWLNWRHCTYALYKLLATEGWTGQKWGLKNAQVDLLGWPESNEAELDSWLVNNGFGKRQRSSTTGEEILRPVKGEMWRAPKEILGRYCALDADSTFLLYTSVLLPALERFNALKIYCSEPYINYVRLLIEQKLSGLLVDRKKLKRYNGRLLKEIEQAKNAILSAPEIQPFMTARLNTVLGSHQAKEPEKYLKRKIGAEPKKINKDGSTSKQWQAWWDRQQLPPTLSKNWEKWNERKLEIEGNPTACFNLNSQLQKKALFYEHLCKDWKEGTDDRGEQFFSITFNGRTVELPATDSGQPPLDKKAMKIFGPVGKLFLNYQDLIKEQQYVLSCLMVLGEDSILHPSFRVPGTLTGRLAGGGTTVKKEHPDTGKPAEFTINIQQIPKSAGYLSCFIPRPGCIWVDCDHAALEQVVLAELSRDSTLDKLYGPGAQPHDVYLFNGASLPGIGERIRAAGYSTESPTASSTKRAKEVCKKERQVAKIVTLGSSYGMGAPKLKRTLMLEGIDITLQEARDIHKAYWQLYQGVKVYEKELLRQYDNNKQWVLNGIGRPLGIYEPYKRDIVNRVVQSTGHDVHLFYILITADLLNQAGINWRPIIIDFHDQMIVEVAEKDAPRVKEIMGQEAYSRLNALLNGRLKLKGDAQIVKNMAEAKCAKEDIEQYLKDLGVLGDGGDE